MTVTDNGIGLNDGISSITWAQLRVQGPQHSSESALSGAEKGEEREKSGRRKSYHRQFGVGFYSTFMVFGRSYRHNAQGEAMKRLDLEVGRHGRVHH
ncbi:MAG: hypothetical protein CM15mP87_01450 [Candidatus Neomarinimicrobiota bacterium]|nr:MAG: hypothetical protein CM15mP87_01450 [Candidatus Neomarinimicrobiota bacterium]